MKFLIRCMGLALLVSLTACVTPPPAKDYSAFTAHDPHSILVVPVVNRSNQVDAASTFLATLSTPLAERGYYVFPVNLVRHTMEDQGLGDADLVAKADPVRLASLFGAQSVLYAEIRQWDAKYIVLSTSVTVEIHYTLKSGVDGKTLWDQDVTTVYQPQQANSGNPIANLIADAIIAAVARAKPNYLPLAYQANSIAFLTPGQGVPFGPYDARHGQVP